MVGGRQPPRRWYLLPDNLSAAVRDGRDHWLLSFSTQPGMDAQFFFASPVLPVNNLFGVATERCAIAEHDWMVLRAVVKVGGVLYTSERQFLQHYYYRGL